MLPNQLDKHLRDSRKGKRRYVHHVYDQQRMGDFSGRCQGPDGLDVSAGLDHSLAGLDSRRLRRVRRNTRLYVVRDHLARNIKAAGSPSRLEICHPRPELCAVYPAAPKYYCVSHVACTRGRRKSKVRVPQHRGGSVHLRGG